MRVRGLFFILNVIAFLLELALLLNVFFLPPMLSNSGDYSPYISPPGESLIYDSGSEILLPLYGDSFVLCADSMSLNCSYLGTGVSVNLLFFNVFC